MFRWLTTCIALLAISGSLLMAEESITEQVGENKQSLLPTVSYPDTGKRFLVEFPDSQPLVGLRGDPNNLQISGLDHVQAVQLQSALALDLVFQAATRQTASLADFLDVVKNRLQAGFLHSGFPDTSVAVEFRSETGKIHVDVSEGRHFVNGEIRVGQANGLDLIALADAIHTPTEKRPWTYSYGRPETTTSDDDSLLTPAWEVGAVTQFNEDSIIRLTTRIRELITDQGFPFARFKVKLIPEDDGKTSLLVEIADPGVRATLSNVRIKGLQRHSEEQLLSYLDLGAQTRLDASVLRDIYSKLRESCRFWNYDVLVRLPSPDTGRYAKSANKVELVISLVEYSHVPPLGEPLSEAEETMKRAAQWLEGYVSKGDVEVGDLVIEVSENPQEDQEEPKGLHGKIILTRRQGISVNVQYPEDEQFSLWHSLVAERGTIEFFDWRQKKKLRAPLGDLSATVKIVWGIGEIVDGEYMNQLTFAFGAETSKANTSEQPLAFTMKCEPVAFVNLLHRDGTKYEWGNDELRVQTRGLEFRIDKKNGRVIQVALDNSDRATNATGSLSFQKNAFVEHVNQIRNQEALLVDCYDSDRPMTSCVEFALRQLIEQPISADLPLCRLLCGKLIRSFDSGWLEELASEMSWSEFLVKKRFSHHAEEYNVVFTIPTNDLHTGKEFYDEFLLHLARAAPPIVDRLFPRGSWPWTFTREASLSMANSQKSGVLAKGWQTELWASMQSEHTGILGHALVALLWEEFKPSAFSKKIAKHAKTKLTESSFVSGIQYFIRGDHWSAQIIAQLVEMVDGLSDNEKSQFHESLSPLFATVFDSLIARRQTHPTEAAPDAVEAVLVKLWRSGWRDKLSERLDNASAEIQFIEQPLGEIAR